MSMTPRKECMKAEEKMESQMDWEYSSKMIGGQKHNGKTDTTMGECTRRRRTNG